jgi:hypothetical protein
MGRRLIFSPRQALAGRLLLGLPRAALAEAAGLEAEAVTLYETGQGGLADNELTALGLALYAHGHGVIPIPAHAAGEGVRLVRSE